ncbi:MAG: M42 family metallopeptidase [Armatimonadetes bacterium]|nr:M42 family metallopeptidase [Armatimonadota bacterium]
MRQQSLSFLQSLIETPSPSGFEQPVQRLVRDYATQFADEVSTDVHGNVIAVKNPGGYPRVMLAGHCDQIGMMVTHITDDGYVYFAAVGGIDAAVMPGLPVCIHTRDGCVPGVIGRKAIHLLKPEERDKAKHDLGELWIDIGAKNKEEAGKLVRVGDPATFALTFQPLQQDLVAGPGFDDKVGSFVVMEALRLLSGKKLKCAVYAVSTVQEELGLRGARTSAYGIDPQVGIAVDVTHATDYPGADAKRTGEAKLGLGPTIARGPNINPPLRELLETAATAKKLPWQPEPEPGATGTDANAIQISRAGVAAALVAIPNRYMHTPVEVVSLADLENAAKIIAETCLRITPQTSFIPL